MLHLHIQIQYLRTLAIKNLVLNKYSIREVTPFTGYALPMEVCYALRASIQITLGKQNIHYKHPEMMGNSQNCFLNVNS